MSTQSPVLVSWVAVHNDPYERERSTGQYRLVQDQPIPGPTLTLLYDEASPYAGHIHDVVLFSRNSPDKSKEYRALTETMDCLRSHDPEIGITVEHWDGEDPTDHQGIFKLLSQRMPLLRQRFAGRELVIHLSPGTPSMQTIWVLFAEEARRYAQLHVPVLLLGERGTGKTTLASWIRMNSPFRREEQDSHWPAVAGGQYTLFAEQALYHSTFVGEFTGRAAIRSMMTDFFARFPDVYWTVTEYRSVDERTVEFTFTMTATAAATGQAVQRQARETLEFTDAGLIARLSVSDLPRGES